MPVTEIATSAFERCSAPLAMASATSPLTAPWASSRLRGNAELLALGFIGIGDPAAVIDIRGAGDGGERAGDEAAGAALGRGDLQLEIAIALQESGNIHLQDSLRASRATVAIACAAMPSLRPVKPSFSVVVAFTLMRCGSMPMISASLAIIASRCGPTFGRSQMMVMSQWVTLAALLRDQLHRMVEELPGRGAPPLRIGGRKCAPISCAAMAPRIASVRRMHGDIGVGMAFELLVMRDQDAAHPDAVAIDQPVHVIAAAGAVFQRCNGPLFRHHMLGPLEIGAGGDLEILHDSRHQHHLDSRGLGHRRIIRHLRPRSRPAVRRQDRIEAKALRRLRAPEAGAVDRLAAELALGALQRVDHLDRRPARRRDRSSASIVRSMVGASMKGAPRRGSAPDPADCRSGFPSPLCTEACRVSPPKCGGQQGRPVVAGS